jgi:hypothetical protein
MSLGRAAVAFSKWRSTAPFRTVPSAHRHNEKTPHASIKFDTTDVAGKGKPPIHS